MTSSRTQLEQNASEEVLTEIGALLSKAVARNPRYAEAFSWLGELRARRASPSAIAPIRAAEELVALIARAT